MPPYFYVVAGPNGVGKSTAAYQYLPVGVELINSDDIAKQIRQDQDHQEVVQRMTNEEAQRRISQHIQKREPFAVETNLHEIETWHYFTAIQQSGYKFRLLFISIDDLPVLYQRVINRHLQGGHFVREDVIRGRYVAGLSLLNHFFNVPDTVTLIDSADRMDIVYQRVDSNLVVQKQPLPTWVTANLTDHFGSAANATPTDLPTSIDDVRAEYQQSTLPQQPPLTKNPNEPPTF